AAIDERGDRLAVDEIEPAPDQPEPLSGEIDDRRRKIEPAVEPRLDGMPVARQHVGQMIRLQRAQMRGDRVAENPSVIISPQDYDRDTGRGGRSEAAHGKALEQ